MKTLFGQDPPGAARSAARRAAQIFPLLLALLWAAAPERSAAAGPGSPSPAASEAESPSGKAGLDPEIVFYGERRFVDNGDGTVTDLSTGLMWFKDADFYRQPIPLEIARKVLQDLNEGKLEHHGYTDWRLPTIKEFQALVDRTQSSPALSVGHPFTNVRNGYYWSSSGGVNIVEYVWLMDMTYGIVKFDYPSYCNFQYLWPVRDSR